MKVGSPEWARKEIEWLEAFKDPGPKYYESFGIPKEVHQSTIDSRIKRMREIEAGAPLNSFEKAFYDPVVWGGRLIEPLKTN